ncbi:long-chain-fatty-acid--CoA ligase [Acuticoccus sediminis]|uniref:long-chain-fatty-acid--CoA ligase n=1 Tax=Acuticoccus sediminis TaxID=2184697 RepID=UPI001CFF2FDA|nr:long-chain-fatty-acid--CoA ligase [Acuticoccus sediminis]
MKGMMMNRPLKIADILAFAAEVYPNGEIISVRTEGDVHRTTYKETAGRVAQLAHALKGLGVGFGDRVATLAWNGYRHFELYYAISGIGSVCHTINPRLSAEQMIYIVNHAQDKVLFVDTTFVPILEKLTGELPDDLTFVIMTDRAHMPENTLNALCYEELLEGQPTSIDWPEFDENTAAGLCYTSGTTGDPKGALYSHRSMVLHTLIVPTSMPGVFAPGHRIMPVVPLFHVNAWGTPYTAPLTGASLIFPGGKLDGPSIYELMDSEKVWSAWGVPTVWLGLLNEIDKRGRIPEGFGHLVVGGSAAPRPMVEKFENLGVDVCHAWGMTEMSPIGTTGQQIDEMKDWPQDKLIDWKSRQGRRIFGVDFKIVDEDGKRLPHDGKTVGELHVRGNTIVAGYFNNEAATSRALDEEGWFGTGDVAHISADGILTITDRAKDLIKSGGEWISSLDLENIVMAHPKVANCAVVAVPHPKWDERPLLVVTPAGDPPTKAELIAMLSEHLAKWQIPDDVVFVEQLPLTATGKVSKLTLRQNFKDYQLPDEQAAAS